MERIHHVAVFTADYQATAGFYRDVLTAEAPERCGQPSVIQVGGVTLHLFEEKSVKAEGWGAHLHHLALEVSDLEEFIAIRNRLLARGACDERVVDFGVGAHISVIASDPDGGMLELVLSVDERERDSLPFSVQPHR